MTESIEVLAARLKAERDAEAAGELAKATRQSAARHASLLAVHKHLTTLTHRSIGGLRVYVDMRGPIDSLSELKVSVSPLSPALCRPMAIWSITAWVSESDAATASIHLVHPQESTSLRQAISKVSAAGMGTKPEEVVQRFSLLVAECINAKDTFAIAPPDWYRLLGNLLGWPLAILVYVICAFGFGLGGVLLGWIPAWIALALSRWLWLPALLVGAFFLARS